MIERVKVGEVVYHLGHECFYRQQFLVIFQSTSTATTTFYYGRAIQLVDIFFFHFIFMVWLFVRWRELVYYMLLSLQNNRDEIEWVLLLILWNASCMPF